MSTADDQDKNTPPRDECTATVRQCRSRSPFEEGAEASGEENSGVSAKRGQWIGHATSRGSIAKTKEAKG